MRTGRRGNLTDLAEARGKHESFTRQSTQKLKVRREHALIENAISSNRIEGVEVAFALRVIRMYSGLQLIMRKLRRLPQSSAGVSPASSGGVPLPGTKRGGTPLEFAAETAPLRYPRAAIVVPNGTLFGDGVCARIKENITHLRRSNWSRASLQRGGGLPRFLAALNGF